MNTPIQPLRPHPPHSTPGPRRLSWLRKTALALALCLTSLLNHPAFAAPIDWIGTVSSDWADSGNWSPAVVPGASDEARFANNANTILDSTRSIDALRFTGNNVWIGPIGMPSGLQLNGITRVTQDGGLAAYLNPNLQAASTLTFDGSGSGVVHLWGFLSGSPHLVVNGPAVNGPRFHLGSGWVPGGLNLNSITVNGGTLNIGNSNSVNVAGPVVVNSGGTLTLCNSGPLNANFSAPSVTINGTLYGNGGLTATTASGVTVGSGGVNSSFNPGCSAGTLTVNGNLHFGANALLNFELATPGVVGNNVNDLAIVNGDLALGGTLNVTALSGFGAGTYRLFSYTGVFSGAAPVFGSMPSGYNYALDTATTGQVNLMVSLPAPVTYTNYLQAGFNFIAIQLLNTNQLLNTLLPNANDGDYVFRWDTTQQDFTEPHTFVGGEWYDEAFSPSSMTLSPGEGAVYFANAPITLVVKGTVPVPVLPLALTSNNFHLVSRQVPGPGTFENIVGHAPASGSRFVRFSAATQLFSTNTFDGFTWSSGAPSTQVGESALVSVTSGNPFGFDCTSNKTVNTTNWSFDTPSISGGCSNASVQVLNTVTNSICPHLSVTRTWRASDSCSNNATCSQTVTVIKPPLQLICPSNQVVYASSNGNSGPIGYPSPTVIDGTFLGCSPSSGTILPVGTYGVVCRATDGCVTNTCGFSVTLLASNTPTTTSCSYFSGLNHCPQGPATLSIADNQLTVANLGSSGQDGVSISLAGAGSSAVQFAVRPANSGPVNATLTGQTFGWVNGASNQLLSSLTMEKTNSTLELSADFAPLGATAQSVQVLSNGVVVYNSGAMPTRIRVIVDGIEENWDHIPFWYFNPELYDIVFIGNFAMTVPNGGGTTTVQGNQVLFQAISPTNATTGLTAFNLTASGLTDFAIARESIGAFGLLHTATGESQLSVASNRLTVANIGSSGQDGVSIAPAGAASLATELATTPSLSVTGATLIGKAVGSVNGMSTQPLYFAEMQKGPTNVLLGADFSPLGTAFQSVQILSNGVTVYDSGASATRIVLIVSGPFGSSVDLGGWVFIWELFNTQFKPPFDVDKYAFTIPDGDGGTTTVEGDTAIFRAVNPTNLIAGGLSAVTLTGSGMNSFALVSEAAPAHTIRCPDDITLYIAGTNVAVNYFAPTVSGGALRGCIPASGSLFPLGTTRVTCATTNAYRTNLCAFHVTVERAFCADGTNLVVNGSFELPVVANNNFTYTQPMSGWTTTDSLGDFEIWAGTFGSIPSPDGNQHLEINSHQAVTTVQQVINNLEGNCPVTLCFYFTGRYADPRENAIELTVLGSGFAPITLYPVSHAVGGWQLYSATFIPVASTVTVQFKGFAASGSQGGGHIDNVALTQDCSVRDGDGDGMPDEWEILHSLNPNNSLDGAEDADGDGASNFDEYLSGNDPQNPLNRLQVERLRVEANGIVRLQFQAAPNRSYSVETTSTFGERNWQTIHSVPAQPVARAVDLVVASNSSPQQFYRVGASLLGFPWGTWTLPQWGTVWGVGPYNKLYKIDPVTGAETAVGIIRGCQYCETAVHPTGIAYRPNQTSDSFIVCSVGNISCGNISGTTFWQVQPDASVSARRGMLPGRYIHDIEYNPVDGALYGFETADPNGNTTVGLVKITSLGGACPYGPYATVQTIATAAQLQASIGQGRYSIAFNYAGQCNIISAADRYRNVVNLPSLTPIVARVQGKAPIAAGYQKELAFCISGNTLIIGTSEQIQQNPPILENSFHHVATVSGMASQWVKKGSHCLYDYTSKPYNPILQPGPRVSLPQVELQHQ